jgi:hypothetical protein
LLILALGLVVVIPAASTVETRVGNRWAVVCGDNPNCAYAGDDAQGMHDTLIAHEWPEDHITQVINQGTSSSAMFEDGIKDLHPPVTSFCDIVVIFYAGHGGWGADVAPLDETDGMDEYLSVPGGSIRDDTFREWLDPFYDEGVKVVVILDCCHSGGAIDRDGVSVRTEPGTPRADLIDSFDRDLKVDGVSVVLTACTASQSSYGVGNPLYHGVFTYFLLEGMGAPGDIPADTDGDNEISAEETFAYGAPLAHDWAWDYLGRTMDPQLYDGVQGEVELTYTSPPPEQCVPEFSVELSAITSIGAVAYLWLRSRFARKKET